jgi:hypothetical protein
MLPFDTLVISGSARRFMDKYDLYRLDNLPKGWYVPDYGWVYTGTGDDRGRYTPDPDEIDYDGPVRSSFDIHDTLYMA